MVWSLSCWGDGLSPHKSYPWESDVHAAENLALRPVNYRPEPGRGQIARGLRTRLH